MKSISPCNEHFYKIAGHLFVVTYPKRKIYCNTALHRKSMFYSLFASSFCSQSPVHRPGCFYFTIFDRMPRVEPDRVATSASCATNELPTHISQMGKLVKLVWYSSCLDVRMSVWEVWWWGCWSLPGTPGAGSPTSTPGTSATGLLGLLGLTVLIFILFLLKFNLNRALFLAKHWLIDHLLLRFWRRFMTLS